MPLNRAKVPWVCYFNGIPYHFSQLYAMNISVSTVLHEWKSSLETVELYAEYLQQTPEWRAKNDRSVCRCHHLTKFGKHCEYAFSQYNNFPDALHREFSIKHDGVDFYQRFGDILCYETLRCDEGKLCLDWRDICDGIQQCMLGYDEENCDLLEFQECDPDEYRCMNGMCIPEIYFLDGEYDCMDLTDEIGFFNDSICPFQPIQPDCDDRLCSPNTFSCGDGQCIASRLAFQHLMSSTLECFSRRDQNFMCEMNVEAHMWTATNGQCLQETKDVEKVNEEKEEEEEDQRTEMEDCVRFFQCKFSQNAAPFCEPDGTTRGTDQLANTCTLNWVQYPSGAIIAPYLTLFYKNPPSSDEQVPDLIQINGSIKCRGYVIHQQINWTNLSDWTHLNLEYLLCTRYFEHGQVSPGGYDQDCYNYSAALRRHLCPQSGECISPYRVRDGYYNCADKSDEDHNQPVFQTCSGIRHHRFRCSPHESTCLPAHHLGDMIADCENQFDEILAGSGTSFSQLACNRQSKEDCALIRRYIEASWNIDYDAIKPIDVKKTLRFLGYCNTFWDLSSHQDEDVVLCKRFWKCHPKQWQCRNGQCIEHSWVLDGEWDCADASDEHSLFLEMDVDRIFPLLNEKYPDPQAEVNQRNRKQVFSHRCNTTIEYPCILINVPSPWLNPATYRPCLHMSKLGDFKIDCVGGIDEKNTLEHCTQSTMLGDNFKCFSTDTCIPYRHVCDIRCPNTSDDDLLCGFQNRQPTCSEKGKDYTCWDGTCAHSSWCDGEFQCADGEDEYLCTEEDEYPSRVTTETIFYRRKKELEIRYSQETFNLPTFSIEAPSTRWETAEAIVSREKRDDDDDDDDSELNLIGKYFTCNRGLHVQTLNKTYACLCPQFYYGHKCQYHQDRLTFIFHLNFSQSSFADMHNTSLVLKLLVLFLYKDQVIRSTVFHVRPALEKKEYAKKIAYFAYPRTDEFVREKQRRYWNRTDILHHQPYAIRVEAYDIEVEQRPQIRAVWQYPIRFDYLPSFRLVKILHLIEFSEDDDTDPCFDEPCGQHQHCHRLLNSPSQYVCLCDEGYGGDSCAVEEPLCSQDYCAPNALCKPNYQGLQNSQSKPYCLCPANKFGVRCFLEYDRCRANPCRNGGTCFPTSHPDRYFCHCPPNYRGSQCELSTPKIQLHIDRSLSHQGALIQYLKIDFYFLDLVLVHQHPYFQLPKVIHYDSFGHDFPQIIVVKLYTEAKTTSLHVIFVQVQAKVINQTTDVTERNRCPSASILFPKNEKISPIKYHRLCSQNKTIACFYDDEYLCICDEKHTRVDCFAYDHSLDRCTRCLAQGHCIQGNPLKTDDFICLCPRCHYGTLCQFNTEQFSFTLDSLIVEDSLTVHLIYLLLTVAILLIGGVMNYASFLTFKRPSPRRVGVGNYLLLFVVFSQCSLFVLALKFVHIIFGASLGDMPCKIVSYFLSVFIRFTYWLMSWITIERVSFVLCPFNGSLKTPRVALMISLLTGIVIAGMHWHELLYYIVVQDPKGQSLCVLSASPSILNYDRIIIMIHYVIPFCIQVISTTLLIILTAQSRSTVRNSNRHQPFFQQLKRQFQSQLELYLAPMIIILSGLPHVILSFSFACLTLAIWQRHAMLIAYFLSHAPQLLGFVLFVLPSSSYFKEFRQTTIAKTRLFQRWTSSRH